MRSILALVGILMALAIVGVLAKKQMSASRLSAPPVLMEPDAGPSVSQNPREQSQQVQEQFRQQLGSALQQQQQRLDKEAQ